MNLIEFATKVLGKLPPKIVSPLEKRLTNIPLIHQRVEVQFDELMKDIEALAKPYREQFPTLHHIPETGWNREEILQQMMAMKLVEESRWKKGYVSGAVYHGEQAHIDFLNQVYALHSQTNPLHSDIFPSISKYEAEIVAMTANMLGAEQANQNKPIEQHICGVVTSGGTESILLAMKTYRDWARETKGITHPEMIIPNSAHAAFEKASQYFKIKLVRIPVDQNYQADVVATRKAITKNTIVIVGSAPSFPHGIIDPIPELSELAREKGIGFHTDACLGGFLLPWAEKLGYSFPAFDFRLPGVTSISADTHKYGYAAKGTSVILYRGLELRRFQYFTSTEWPGGLYFSPTFGSRPGALSAACWAAMVSIGEKGYIEATKRILETAEQIKQGIRKIPDLYVLGDPLWVIAFSSHSLDIYKILDFMTSRNWSLNGLHKPAAIHLCVTLRHTQPGVAQRFLDDLNEAVEFVRANPSLQGTMAPIYGLAATIPLRGVVSEMLKRYLDLLYKT